MIKEYPKEFIVSKWMLCRESTSWTIRRSVINELGHKVSERYPRHAYKHLLSDQIELENFVTRANYRCNLASKQKQDLSITNAFVSEELLESYHKLLRIQIPNKKNADHEFFCLKTYVLRFFIGELKLKDPVDWHKVHKTSWAEFLTSDPVPNSTTTKKLIIASCNHFFKYLSDHYPREIPFLKFEPFTRGKLKEIRAVRELNEDIRHPQYILETHWDVIAERLPEDIRSAALLGYYYGLRRSEILGLKLEDVRNRHLFIQRQLYKAPLGGANIYKILKGKEVRKVPHWYLTPDETYKLISSLKVMSPFTLAKKFTQAQRDLDFEYYLHDLRHTFCTNAMKTKPPLDVKLAMGHQDIQTTMRYANHDYRDLSDAPFKPC